MMSVYAIFFAEVAAYRIGNKRMEKLGMTYNTHADAEAEHGHSHAHENLNNGNALDESISPIGSSEEGVAGVNVGAGSKLVSPLWTVLMRMLPGPTTTSPPLRGSPS
jgi:hypothetical protein